MNSRITIKRDGEGNGYVVELPNGAAIAGFEDRTQAEDFVIRWSRAAAQFVREQEAKKSTH